MGSLIKKQPTIQKPLSLKSFYEKKDEILIWHDKGGLGDVLMQRMMFKDFKELLPNSNLVFACLPEYIDAAKDHPSISKVIDSRYVKPEEYVAHYNTCVTIADRYENRKSPFCTEHRADIWSKYCGVSLKNHDMLFNLDQNMVGKCREKMQSFFKNERPIVLFSPTSKMKIKSLLKDQIDAIIESTKHCNLVGIHRDIIPELQVKNIPILHHISIKEWMGYIAASDYVISVDSAAFHMAGGLKKPLVGIFTFADGKVYGKHFDFILVQKHRDNGNWSCGPCFKFHNCPKCKTALKPCLTELGTIEITEGVNAMFEKWPFEKKRISLA